MGQANSRSSPPASVSHPQLPQPSSSSSSTTPAGPSSQISQRDDLESSTATTPSSKASRRSVRRSVRSFLRPRTLSDSPTPSSSSSRDQVPSFRKRWRSSRRFSKAQASLPNLSEALHEGDIHTAGPAAAVDAQVLAPDEQPVLAGPSTSAPLSAALPPASCSTVSHLVTPDAAGQSGSEALSAEDHCSTQDHVIPPAAQQSSPSALDANKPDVAPQYRENQERAQEIEREINDFLLERPRQDSLFVEGSSQDGQLSDAPESSPAESPMPLPEQGNTAEAPPQAPRHFPPPGTLVVVQGVVNTSDNPSGSSQSAASGRAPRPSSAVNPASPPAVPTRRSSSVPRTSAQPEERQSARSRLSSFIPRPSSMLRQRSSTSDPSTLPFHASQSSSDVSSTALDSSASSDSLAHDSDPASSSGVEQRSSEDTDIRSRPLSPGSIDVLGTLLSVAAAATAASLFSPSLGFQANSDPNAPPQPSPAIPRPMSPTPTAGLGGGPGFSVVPDLGGDSLASASSAPTTAPQQREGRERIRNVWESFRDRLGLNRSAAAQANGGASSNAEDPASMRPGEIMLAEMARALNVGLGLTGDTANPGAAESNAERAEGPPAEGAAGPADSIPTAARPPPPEDSFERFLLNLQADLRVALSENGAGGNVSTTPQDGDTDAAREEAHVASSSNDINLEPPASAGDGERTPSSGDDGDQDELPPLEDVSDSEDDDFDEMNVGEDHSSARIPTPMPSGRELPNRTDQSSPNGGGEDERGEAERRPPGIHLWRLYRFRPIHASQIAGHAASTTSPTTPAFPHSPPTTSSSPPVSAETSPRPEGERHSASPASIATSPTASASTDGAESPSSTAPATDPNANMVVPVIVVGLQSVEMGQVHGHAHTRDVEVPPPDTDDWATGRQDEDYRAMSQEPGDQAGDATPRGRSWQSRAATALRSLRPGRRNASRAQQATEGSGSRTFLIYVIGGYYPPNHHMVTGPDNLDSYEALWELAELLGQVKPQVATREDIEKSDLKTVKFNELEQYEREGKVASSCVERCLICLDDYQPDDDVRLMHCRHAFHKDCVDKWLQVGRNNCPACRTKGVSTADELVP
ncbi:hypothetical protein BV20DRAFT_971251 [Pilatotrama ljubarskyi]|nr:hypothetical protein BV20DRAFT_971251 [Pilatotrama ljubarskyi]